MKTVRTMLFIVICLIFSQYFIFENFVQSAESNFQPLMAEKTARFDIYTGIATKDTFIMDGSYSGTNFGGEVSMSSGYTAGYNAVAFIQFPLPAGVQSDDIVSAKVWVNMSLLYASGNFDICKVNAEWGEMSLTWDSGSSWDAYDPEDTLSIDDTGHYEFDITDLAKQWKNGSEDNYGVVIWAGQQGSGGYIGISSREASEEFRPRIIIEYSDSTPTPTPAPTSGPITPTPNYLGNTCENAYEIGLNNEQSSGVSKDYPQMWFKGTAPSNGSVRSRINNNSDISLNWYLYVGGCASGFLEDSGTVSAYTEQWGNTWYDIDYGETAYFGVIYSGSSHDLKNFDVEIKYTTPTTTPSVVPSIVIPTRTPSTPPCTSSPTMIPTSTPTSSPSPTLTPTPTNTPWAPKSPSPTPVPSYTPTPHGGRTPSATPYGMKTPQTPTPSPSPIPTLSPIYVIPPGDYDGDGTSDLAIYRPAKGLWHVRGLTRIYFGTSEDEPVPQDYDGDGAWDVAYFRPSNGLWKVKDLTRIYFGRSSDLQVPGDYNGDSTAEPAYFRPTNILWNVRDLTRIYFGRSSDTPIPDDYDGDGSIDPTFFRSSNGLWKVRNFTSVYFGISDDILVPGDYNGDGTVDFAWFRPTNGLWKVKDVTRVYFGTGSDTVFNGDFDGDGTADLGYFRPPATLWKIRDVTQVYFGQSADTQVSNP